MCRPALTAGFLAYSFHSLLTARLIFGFQWISFLLTEFWAYGFHYYSPACFLELTAFTITHCSPHVGRHNGEIFPGGMHWTRSLRPPTAPTAWRTGSPDRQTDHLDHRSWPSLEGPTSTDGLCGPITHWVYDNATIRDQDTERYSLNQSISLPGECDHYVICRFT